MVLWGWKIGFDIAYVGWFKHEKYKQIYNLNQYIS